MGTAVTSVIIYPESVTAAKTVFMLLIIVGIVGLQLQGSE
jgi:multidrug transporter EmrE-like cation transporter